MVIIVLAGGIGNQLQQFAYGYSLAKTKRCKLILDAAWYRSSNKSATFPFTLTKIVDTKGCSIINNIHISRLLRITLFIINCLSLGLCSYKRIQYSYLYSFITT